MSTYPFQIIYYMGTMAIPLFFMTNGYLILNKREINYHYILKKVLSIFLVIISWNLLILLIFLIKGDFHNPLVLHPLMLFFGSIFLKGYFFQFWFLWSLILMLFFAPLLAYLLKRRPKIFTAILASLIAISIIIDVVNHLFFSVPLQEYVPETFRLWTWLSYYMLGGYIGKNKIYIGITKLKLSLLIIFTVVTVLFFVVNKEFIGSPYTEYNYDSIVCIIWTFVLFVTFANVHFYSNHINSIIMQLSLLSMGVYIIHWTIVKILTKFIYFTIPAYNLLGLTSTIILSFAITLVLYKLPYLNKLVKL